METDWIKNIDCLEGMKELPDKSVDMILCDLPYGTTRNKWDSVIPLEPLWDEYKRIIKRGGAIVLTSQMPFAVDLINSNRDQFRYEWIWKKNRGVGFLNANRLPLRAHENVLVFYDVHGKYNPQGLKIGKKQPSGTVGPNYDMESGYSFREQIQNWKKKGSPNSYGDFYDLIDKATHGKKNYPIDILDIQCEIDIEHPTQKPVPLFEYLIKTYTDEGDLVLDNCMGSGTTAVACIRSGRHFIGYETDKGYYDIAMRRISESKRVWDKQTRLI